MSNLYKVDNQPEQAPALCVDLDGTLVRSDTLVETFISVLRNWAVLFRLPFWLFQGKARFKANLARHANLNASLLPYNDVLLKFLREQKKIGRYLVLATAANENIAKGINEHLHVFDEIFASDESKNLRGEVKAKALVERFGERGFSYIGNDKFDLPVWRRAFSGVLVNVPESVAKEAANLTQIERVISNQTNRWRALLKALRPHQWVKNLLVFVPIVTSGAFNDFNAILQSIIMFAAFCCTASAIYIINDLYDIDADRKHITKRKRPFASGTLSIIFGAGAAISLILFGFFIASMLHSIIPLFLLLSYCFFSIAYSVKLKTFPLVDVFTLALLYTLRLFSGGEATGYHVSFWLLAFSGFLFLSLACIKRVSELSVLVDLGEKQASRRGYTTDDALVLQMFGVASSFLSSLIVVFYINDHAAEIAYQNPHILWLLVPFLLFWQCRLWLSTTRGYMNEDPIVYTGKDWVSWLTLFIFILIITAAKVDI
jgi:4-hydroxybenzoate polyprenyltransferase